MVADPRLESGSDRLLEAVREFAAARTLEEVTAVVRRRARRLTGADGVTFVLRDEGQCFYVDEDAIAPLWKGRRFSMDACISGWVMKNASPVVIEDIYRDDRVPHEAYRPTFVQSLAMVPIQSGEPIGAIGAYWSERHEATPSELRMLQVLADSASVALRNVELIQEIEAKEARYRAIVEDQTELIMRWLPDGTRTFVNEACCRLFQRSRRELLDEDLYASIHADDRIAVRKKIESLSPESPSAMDQRRTVLPDGSTVWTEWVDRGLFGEDGRVREYQSVGREIGDRIALEQQLRQAQKMDAIGRLAGGVAHDFNNVLTVISSHTDLALESVDRDDPIREDLEEVGTAAKRAASLTNRLLTVSRSQALEPEVVDLNRVVDGMESMLRRLIGEPIELVFNPASNLGSVWADVGQLEQVILNLSVNARDAMPDGGRLTIETRNVVLGDDMPAGRLDVEPGSYVMLAASDTGSGMSPEVQEHLFEPFYTTKREGKGTGLGLSIVFGIVKQSRGDVYVYSEPGAGTTFKIYLPRTDASERPAEPLDAIPSEEPETRGGTILVVEDDDSVRELQAKILEDAGYRVLTAPTGDDARRLFANEGVDLLVTDMVLPEMDGLDLARELTASRPTLPVLFVSGYTESGFGELRSVSPIFLEKPFSADSLLEKTRQAFRLGANEGRRTVG